MIAVAPVQPQKAPWAIFEELATSFTGLGNPSSGSDHDEPDEEEEEERVDADMGSMPERDVKMTTKERRRSTQGVRTIRAGPEASDEVTKEKERPGNEGRRGMFDPLGPVTSPSSS